jgi:hypothetical protein
MKQRPFRFGAVFRAPHTAATLSELARRLEGEGLDTLLIPDHYLPNVMATGPALIAAANATATPRVGSYAYNNDFRHPALVAREAATVDLLSGGRMEVGIGAGYLRQEYEAAGLPFDAPGVRARRFEEAIARSALCRANCSQNHQMCCLATTLPWPRLCRSTVKASRDVQSTYSATRVRRVRALFPQSGPVCRARTR